ncbi:probable glucuronoxylan glucuronosyltransferase IRX7 isoform X2 [Physcomitrium patens]|uniref:probable glucuronoxylan glucuronosyltransferase IRX7 isoform X2 n=1 Tax=Physcomitrium patens TaxID=3218 RepID=UPI003CCE0ABB
MHRVSVVEWKGNGHRGIVSYGTVTSFSKHYKHEATAMSHSFWKKRRSIWLSICILFTVFVLCVSVLPAPMDVSENLETGPLELLRKGLPIEKKSYVLHERMDGLEKSRKEWQLKPDHFTFYNTLRNVPTPFNPLNLTNGIRVYVYDLPQKFNKDWLVDERCSNHLFASEVAIHKILLSSPIKTLNPYEADFFFMPVYFSCKFSSKTGFPRLGHAPKLMEDAVNHVSSMMEFWNRSGGKDHVFVAAHDFGACFHSLESEAIAHGIPEIVQSSLILQTFGVHGFHPCQAAENIQIPPYISPSTVFSYVKKPPEEQRRNIFAFFRGKMEINPKNVSGLVYSSDCTCLQRREDIYLQEVLAEQTFFLKATSSRQLPTGPASINILLVSLGVGTVESSNC